LVADGVEEAIAKAGVAWSSRFFRRQMNNMIAKAQGTSSQQPTANAWQTMVTNQARLTNRLRIHLSAWKHRHRNAHQMPTVRLLPEAAASEDA